MVVMTALFALTEQIKSYNIPCLYHLNSHCLTGPPWIKDLTADATASTNMPIHTIENPGFMNKHVVIVNMPVPSSKRMAVKSQSIAMSDSAGLYRFPFTTSADNALQRRPPAPFALTRLYRKPSRPTNRQLIDAFCVFFCSIFLRR